MWKRSVLHADEALTETLVGGPFQDAHRLKRAMNTGACMMVQHSTLNGTELGVQEWQDALLLRYVLDLPYLPKLCYGCNATFSIFYALNCKREGLVMARHNELYDGVADLASKAFNLNHVRDNPLIFAGFAVKRKTEKPARSKTTPSTNNLKATEHKGDLLIRDL